MTDWNAIASVINECGGPAARKIGPEDVEALVALHGWSAVGEVMNAYGQTQQLRALVHGGMPFEEAIKMFGLAEVPNDGGRASSGHKETV